MTNYQPSNPTIERLKTLFKRRVSDGDLAYLGDHEGAGARVDVPGMDGYVYCHYRFGNKLGSPFPVLAADVAYVNSAGAPVYIGYGKSGELQLVEAHYKSLRQAGINTQVLNPLNQQSKWVYLWQITIGKALAIATSATASTRVTVKSFWHFVGDRFQVADTPLQADKPDLSSYIPSADEHRYATLWLDTYTNDFEVTTSTAQATSAPLDYTDVQETVSGRPPDAVPLEAFYLANAQTTIQQNRQHVDVRQFLNMPVLLGFPQTLDTRERVWPDRTFVIPGDSSIGTGSITLEPGARLLRVHKSTIAATAPTTGDDSADGYSVGSRWLDSVTGILYIATNVSVGAAVWLAVSSGGTFTSFDVAADSGTPETVSDGDIVTFVGGTDLSTTVSNPDTITIVHDNSGVSAGTYAYPASIDVNARGHITSITGGSAPVDPPFLDTNALVKGSADATKLLRFEVDGFTTGQTRVMTPPDYDGTLATLAGAETLTNKTLTGPKIDEILDSNGNEVLSFTGVSSAVNEVLIINAATGNRPILSSSGESNIGLIIRTNGTGAINVDNLIRFNEDQDPNNDVQIRGGSIANLFYADVSVNSIGFGTGAPNASTLFHASSTSKASIPAPVMTTTQRDAISSPVEGMHVWVSDQDDASVYTGSDWINLRRPFYSEMLNPFSEHTNISGAALIWVSDVNQAGAGFYRKSAGALNDQTDYTIAFPTGVYHIEYMAVRGGSAGVMSIIIDGNTVSTHDLYTAATTYNTRGSSSNFNINVAGNHTLSIKAASKNASSSNYFMGLSWLQIIKTAEYP